VGLYILEWIYGVDTGSITTLALIAGIMECVPYIGPFLALAPALVLGLGISWQFGVSILVLYIVVQQVENNLLVPYIMSKSLDLSPLLVLVVMIAGASLGGILGIVLAVPVAGVVQMLYRDYRGEEK
jgi:predicted PurR-regulated permease PerM